MAILLLLLALFGIGVVGSTTEESSSEPASPLRPPALELRSEAGSQRAVQGSYCVTGEGSGECVDYAGPVVPERASVVRPGAYEIAVEAVTFEAGSTSGDTTAILGLVVDAAGPLAVRPAGRPVTCPAG